MKRYRFERDAEQDRDLDEAGQQGREARARRVAPGKVPRSLQLGEDAHLSVAVGAGGKGLPGSPVSPGKRAPSAWVGSPAPEAISLQHRRARAPGVDERRELEIAARGLSDSGGPLPYLEELQRAFGRHALKDIRAATGDEAGRANERMGSVAYAMGDTVVFRDSSPDLFTVAHEVAHVIQQRAGSVPTGTIGQSGDRHEAHADAVAERVVRGQSAEDLLDQVAPGGARDTAAPASVQRFDDEDYTGLSTNHAILQALLDGDEDDALTLMRRVNGASEANLVLNSCQALATSCLDDSEVAEAAGILVGRGGSLSRALEWMYDEGTDWIALLTVISCASPGQRAALTSDAWRRHFVSELGEEEMSELVDLLGMSLFDKLDWMWQVGTDDWSAVRSKIVAAPAEERAELVSNDWRDWFVEDVVDGEKMSELVDLLGMPLVSKLDWMGAAGSGYEPMIGKIAMAPADQRVAIHEDSAVLDMIRAFEPHERRYIVEAVGGTPAQQMELFGADSAIALLTWATPSADWVDAIIAVRETPLDLFEVATGDPTGWGPFIRPRLWEVLENHEETLYPKDRVGVFWAAYGSGSIFSADQILHFFKLVFGREIQPANDDITKSTGLLTRRRYSVVAPTTDTARALMDCVKPGGGGATGIARAEVATGPIAFCTHRHKEELGINGWTTLRSDVLDTSCFDDPYVIIRAVGPDPDALGVQPGERDTRLIPPASDGTPLAVGLDFFQNHVRHEIGHAVGARAFGTMRQSGNEFAIDYGGWEKSSKEEFLGAMWSGQSEPATGWPTLAVGAVSVTVTDSEVRDWCLDVIKSGTEPSNALGTAPGSFTMKKAALAGSMWSGEKMVAYLASIGGADAGTVPASAYKFPGFTPGSPVHIFSTRWGNRFVKYADDAHSAFMGISWYGLSSPHETFAELYTARYGGGGSLPVATRGGDPDAFFTELEAQRDPMFGAPPEPKEATEVADA